VVVDHADVEAALKALSKEPSDSTPRPGINSKLDPLGSAYLAAGT